MVKSCGWAVSGLPCEGSSLPPPQADISTALSADDWPVAPANTDFCDWYADAAEGDFYERFSAVLDAAWPKKTSRDRSLVNYAMCAVVEEQWFTQLQKQSK